MGYAQMSTVPNGFVQQVLVFCCLDSFQVHPGDEFVAFIRYMSWGGFAWLGRCRMCSSGWGCSWRSCPLCQMPVVNRWNHCGSQARYF